MGIKRRVVAAAGFCLFFVGNVGLAHADSAVVLPKGVSSAALTNEYYFPTDEWYNPDGDVESIATDYNDNLNSTIFPSLGLIEGAFGMPAGSASIGNSVVNFEYETNKLIFDYRYGLTDKLTVGVRIPYWWRKNNVDAKVDTSNATVGVNPNYGTPQDQFGVPIIPVAAGGVKNDALATEAVQSELVNTYGFDRLETWSGNSIGDIEAGGRFQYLNRDTWRCAVTGGLRFPTGYVNSPDILQDLDMGDGVYAIFLHLNNDYTGIKNTVLNFTARYDLELPDHPTLRVPDSDDQPVTKNKEKVDRNIGDVIELEASGAYQMTPALKGSLLYTYTYKFKDSVSGDMGFKYSTLEDDTKATSHIVIAGLSYSTLPLYKEKKFSVPMDFSVAYRNRFAGSGDMLKSQYVSVGLGVYF